MLLREEDGKSRCVAGNNGAGRGLEQLDRAELLISTTCTGEQSGLPLGSLGIPG